MGVSNGPLNITTGGPYRRTVSAFTLQSVASDEGFGHPAGRNVQPAGRPERVPAQPREETYQALWNSYRDGIRSIEALRKAHHVGWRVVRHAIEHGWPPIMPPMKERVRITDRQRDAACKAELATVDRQAAEARGRAEAMTWATFQPQALALSMQTAEQLELLNKALRRSLSAATFMRYRTVRTIEPATGKRVTVDQPYVDAVAAAQALRLLVSAGKENAGLVGFLTGNATGGTDLPDVPEISPEQLAEIQAGRLPAGLSLADIWAATQAAEGEHK